MGNPDQIDLAGNTLIVKAIRLGADKAGEQGDSSADVQTVGILEFATSTNSSPANGDLWYDGTDLNFHTGGSTEKLEYQA